MNGIIFILLAFIPTALHGYEIVPLPTAEDFFFTREFHTLTRVLSDNITRRKHDNNYHFHRYFFGENARYNVSQGEFADTCLNFYIQMKPTALELIFLESEIPDVMKYLAKSNNTTAVPEIWNKTVSSTYFVYRRTAIEEMSSTAPPEARNFMLETFDSLVAVFFSTLADSPLNADKIVKSAIEKIANSYKKLSIETRVDLERSFCIRNTLRWINSDFNGVLSPYSEHFTDHALNIDDLLKDNDYLSGLSKEEVKQKFKKRAELIDIPAQEYVDNCAEMYNFFKPSDEELAQYNKSTESFMGEKWGKQQYGSAGKFMDVLLNENAPFIRMLSKRFNFMKTRSQNFMYGKTPMRNIEMAALSFLQEENNKQAKLTKREKLALSFVNFLEVLPFGFERMQEQMFCLKSTIESIMQQEIETNDVDHDQF